MRRILATAFIVAATSGAALAADLPYRTAPVFSPPPPPVFTWSGGYFGINAGYDFNYNSRFVTTNGVGNAIGVGPLGARPAVANIGSDGFTAGGQIGYNYEFASGVLLGIEADAAYTDLGQTSTYTGGAPARNSVLHSDMDFLGTVRGRLGYAFDRFLVYGTGGFAFGDVSQSTRFFNNAGTLTFAGSRSDLDTGYAYGGGVEYAMPTDSMLNFFHSSAVTVKAEYLHYDLGTQGLAVPATAIGGLAGTYTQRIRTDGDLARIGVNYKF